MSNKRLVDRIPIAWIRRVTSGRAVKMALLIIGMVALTVGIVFLLVILEDYLDQPLEEFALYAYLIVFLGTLLGSATIIFPAPAIALVFAAASQWNPVWVGVAASIGGTLGEITAYYAGYWGRIVIKPGHSQAYQKAEAWMKRYGMLTIFLFALFPFLIFDLAGIAAGVLRLPVRKFLLACWAGRLPRSIFEAYVGYGLIPIVFPTWFG